MDIPVDVLLWAGIILAGLISVPAILYVIWPLLQPGPTLPLVDDDRLADLLVRKDMLLSAIKELEFDHEMGKVADEDYARFSARLRRQALGIMQQIDKIAPESVALDAKLEAEIARLRKVQSNNVQSNIAGSNIAGTAPDSSSANGSAAPASERARQDERPAGAAPTDKHCTQCGKPVGPNHKFCAECGAPVGEAVG